MTNIIFKSDEHKNFFVKYVPECRYEDAYHLALVYCLGIDSDTRYNINSIYNFKTGLVKSECLNQGWITSGSGKIIRMAFNLYCNDTPSLNNYDNSEDQIHECKKYTVEDLFCCGYAPYFWQAIQIRYPEYCN